MKANDNIPEDEMLLAEAIAAARAKGKRWGMDRPFTDRNGDSTTPGRAYAVCALGALHLAGRVDMTHRILPPFDDDSSSKIGNVIYGNDLDGNWQVSPNDRGESLGWAFRCAMTQDGEP